VAQISERGRLPKSRRVSLSIGAGTHFQFRSDGADPLEAVAVTMPPWPGEGEATIVEGKWPPNV
jgi:mannose-6-phosphate isomerase-like protein (cupin superfamily)